MDKEKIKPESHSKTEQPQGIGPAQEMPDGYAPVIQALDHLQVRVHEISVGMGHWEGEPSELELHANMHVDLAKATVAVQEGLPLYNFQELEPTGELVELADCVLHILDYCGSLGISLGQVMVRKHLHDRRMIDRKRRGAG